MTKFITVRTNRPGGILSGLVSGPKFNRYSYSRITNVLHKKATRLFKAAVQEFIYGILDRVHIDTGMSAASLQPLAAQVRLRTAVIETLRGYGPKPGHKSASGSFVDNNAPFKSRALGERLGRAAYTLDFGSPYVPKFKMTFEIPVLQFYLHEFGYARNNTFPWASLKNGQEKFERFIRKNWKKYIKPSDLKEWLLTGEIHDVG